MAVAQISNFLCAGSISKDKQGEDERTTMTVREKHGKE